MNGSDLLGGRSHCGAVTLRLPLEPARAKRCSCSFGRRLGAVWAYYDFGMNEADLQSIRQRLLDQRAELESIADVASAAARPVELDQSSVGRLSRMDAMQAQSMALETERRREAQLVRIEGALRRIEAGEFGYCFACGEEIEARRLDFDLTTTRCIGCKELE